MVEGMPETAITIGNFDGVHLGHAQLVHAARSAVGPSGRVVAIFFDPHPAVVLRPPAMPPRLSTAQQREGWLKQAGADECIVIRPTLEFLRQSPEQFIGGMARQFLPRYIVEGSDFRFGKGRAGSIDTLRQLEKEHAFTAVVVDSVQAALSDQSIVLVGSSLIRWLLNHGRTRDAWNLLGRPYELIAPVVKGEQRGRAIGVPTINLGDSECMLPADGIYSGEAARPDGTAYPAAISVGTKPTFGQHPRTCEAHLIGYDGPLNDYGWTVQLKFHDWLRDQLAYPTVELLVDQLKRDIDRVRSNHIHRRGAKEAETSQMKMRSAVSASLR